VAIHWISTSRLLVVLLLLGMTATLIGSVGCTSVESTVNPVDKAHLKVLGILYGKFLSKHRGRAPANRDQFLDFLNSKRPSWEKIVSSAEQLITSPLDGKPLSVLYGKAYIQLNNQDTFWMAYEREGVNGLHQVINIRGNVEKMDSQQINTLFPEQR